MKYLKLENGGKYVPKTDFLDKLSNKKHQTKVAIIVPYRDRDRNLLIFLYYMHQFLSKQNIYYGIYLVEPVESFGVFLSAPVNGVLGNSAALVTVVDNDATAVATPVVSVSDVIVDEAAGEAVFVVSLDRPGTGVVTLNYATADGTAVAGSDYTGHSGSLSFAAGEMVKTVRVGLADDGTAESAENFALVLSGVTGASAPDVRAVAAIAASDQTAQAQVVITVEDTVIGESAGYAEFVVRLSGPATGGVSVSWQAGDATAVYGGAGDYVLSSGTLVFAAGETVKTVRVAVTDDAVSELLEHFVLNLLAPSSNATIARAQGLAYVSDNDGANSGVRDFGSVVADTLTGGVYGDVLSGGEGHDQLMGLAGDDLLFGLAGVDVDYLPRAAELVMDNPIG